MLRKKHEIQRDGEAGVVDMLLVVSQKESLQTTYFAIKK